MSIRLHISLVLSPVLAFYVAVFFFSFVFARRAPLLTLMATVIISVINAKRQPMKRRYNSLQSAHEPVLY